MKSLLRSFEEIKLLIKKIGHLLLLLDYDGTLIPIADTPGQALLPDRVKKLLQLILQKTNITLGLVSGRSLSDTKKMVPLSGIYFAGNHGFEIEGPGVSMQHEPAAKSAPIIKELCAKLNEELKGVKGIIIEEKGFTASLHYRLSHSSSFPKIRRILTRVTEPYLESNQIRITQGKKIFEIRPPIAWDKGRAVLWIKDVLQKQKGVPMLPLYIGDDETDEDAFKALKKIGLSVKVGEDKTSSADYYLKDTAEVEQFLRMLVIM